MDDKAFCESCGSNAEFTLSRTSGAGCRAERNLCAACAGDAEKILFGDSGLLLTDLLKALEAERFSKNEQHRTKVCPDCGNTVDEVNKFGVLGCVACYTVFQQDIHRLVWEMHGYSPGQGKPV